MKNERFSSRSPESELLRVLQEVGGERLEREKAVREFGDIYLRRARTAPESICALEVRLLRRSSWAPLRAPAVLLWSRRRPRAFLRAAVRFLEDEPEVRRAVAEGLANAAILDGRGADDPLIARLLEKSSADPDERVRTLTEQTRALLSPDPDPS